jgi:hypothetical protein
MDYGLAAMQQTIASAKKGGSDAKLNYITWKDGETKIVRFLSNDPLTGSFVDRVATNDGKTKDFLINPDKGDFVAKYGGRSKDWQTGILGEPKISKRGVAVAVVRTEVMDPATGRREITDLPHSVQFNNQTYPARFFGIIKTGLGNFWKPLVAVAESRCDGITDRDWAITRVGGDKDTVYVPSPIEPIGDQQTALRDLATLHAYYGYGRPWNPEDPNRFGYCPETLLEWVEYYSSEERAKFWLTPKAGAAPPAQPAPGQWGQIPGIPQAAPLVNPALVNSGLYGPGGVPTALTQPAPAVMPYAAAPAAPGASFSPIAPPPAPQTGLDEFHPSTTTNPAQAPAPWAGAPVVSTATGVPVVHQQPVPQPPPFVPTPPGQPVPTWTPVAPVTTAVNQGPWGNNEDEAQAVPSGATNWATLQEQLLPTLAQQAVLPIQQ